MERAGNLPPHSHLFAHFPVETIGRISARRIEMKRHVAIAMICALSACSGTPQQQGSSGVFSGGAGYNIGTKTSAAPAQVPSAPALVARAAPPTTLPYYAEKSRQYSRRGKALSQKSAALAAFRSRESFWRQGDAEAVQLGKYKLRMRQVRVDTHDFVVVQHASHTFGARKFGLNSKAKRGSGCQNIVPCHQ